MTPRLSRQAIRELVEDHARRQYAAECEGRWHAVQNDLNDELADAREMVRQRAGDLEAERFSRIYTEEVLAYERDFHSNPLAGARRMSEGYRDVGRQRQPQPQQPHQQVLQLAAPRRNPSQGTRILAIILIIAGAAALLF